MTTKTTGAELKRFYANKKYWPDGVYQEDDVIEVNGEYIDDFNFEDVLDADILTIKDGCVLDSPLYENGDRPSLEAYFRRWKKEQSIVSFVIECNVSALDAVKAAVKAAGAKVLK